MPSFVDDSVRAQANKLCSQLPPALDAPTPTLMSTIALPPLQPSWKIRELSGQPRTLRGLLRDTKEATILVRASTSRNVVSLFRPSSRTDLIFSFGWRWTLVHPLRPSTLSLRPLLFWQIILDLPSEDLSV